MNLQENHRLLEPLYVFMCKAAFSLDRVNYMDIAHDVYCKLVNNEDLRNKSNLKAYVFISIVNEFKNIKGAASFKYRVDFDGVDIAVNDFIDTDKLNRLTDFELDLVAVIIACEGNLLKVHKLTKISRGSIDKYS